MTFYPGQTLGMFNISIRDDFMKQSNRSFSLTIDPSSIPSGVVVGELGKAIVTIMDNDSK